MAIATETVPETVEDLIAELGGIAPSRFRLKPPPGTATEADLITFNTRKTTLCELVAGVLVDKGMNYRESFLATYLSWLL